MYERAISIAEEMIARLEEGATKESFADITALSIDFCESIPASIKHGLIPLVFFEHNRQQISDGHAKHLLQINQSNQTRAFIYDQVTHPSNKLANNIASSFEYAFSDPYRDGKHFESGMLWFHEYTGTESHTGIDGNPHQWKVVKQRFSPSEKDGAKFIGVLKQWVRYLGSFQTSKENGEATIGLQNDCSASLNNNESQFDKLPRSQKLAYLAAEYAEITLGKELKDKEAWDYLNNYGFGDYDHLNEYQLPSIDTFSTYLSRARKALGTRRYTRKHGRFGRSIIDTSGRQLNLIKSDQI